MNCSNKARVGCKLQKVVNSVLLVRLQLENWVQFWAHHVLRRKRKIKMLRENLTCIQCEVDRDG